MTLFSKTCTTFGADDVGTDKIVKEDVCLSNMKVLNGTKKNTTINTTLLPLLPSSPLCTTFADGVNLPAPCMTTPAPKVSRVIRRRNVTLPWFYGNALVLVLLLLSMMIVVVESYSKLPDGNGGANAYERTEETLNRVVDDWLETDKRPGIERKYGPIGDWDVSSVKNFKYLFNSKGTFNADISKWNVAAAENMESSEC